MVASEVDSQIDPQKIPQGMDCDSFGINYALGYILFSRLGTHLSRGMGGISHDSRFDAKRIFGQLKN